MSSELRKTVGHASIYTIGIMLNRLVSFIMLPVYTRYLSPADYGILELLELVVDVVSIVAGLGILNGLAKFYYQFETEEDRNELVSTLFLLVLVFYSVTCLLSSLSSGWISLIVLKDSKYAFLVFISFINLFLQIMFHMNVSYLRTKQRSKQFVVMNTANLFMKLSLNILFVVFMDMKVLGVLISSTISFIILGAGMTLFSFREVGIRFSRSKAVDLIRFGYPFIFSSFCAFILTYSDRFFLNHYQTLSEVGIYALGYKFGFLLMMFPVSPMMNIWLVQRFEIVKGEGFEQTFNKFLTWFIIVTISVALFIALVVKDALKILSAPEFWPAYQIVPIVLLAYFFQACTDFFNFGIYYSGRTKHIAYGAGISAVVILALSFFMIPRYGIFGAAWATLVSFIIRLVYFYKASQWEFKIRYDLRKPVATTCLAVGTYLVYRLASNSFNAADTVYVTYSLMLLSMLLYMGMLFAVGIIESNERKYIFSFIRYPKKHLMEFKKIHSGTA